MQAIFDAAWHRLALAGDAAAVRILAESSIQPLYRFCFYRLGRNRALCEEVVQETLLRAIRDLASYQPERAGNNVFPWLTGLARNEIRRTLAREKAGGSLDAFWRKVDADLAAVWAALEAEPMQDEQLRREETCELVNATMAQLQPQYREALEAKYISGRSVRDLALLWQTTEKAVESRLSRARQAFRAVFLTLAGHLETGQP